VLGTPSGIYVHSDAEGINRLYSHTKDEEGVNNHWFVAEESDLRVGQVIEGADRDTISCKKGRFVQIGLEGMGTRANCFVVISIPNKQSPPKPTPSYFVAEKKYVTPTYGSTSNIDLTIPYIHNADQSLGTFRSLGSFRSLASDEDGTSMAAIVSADKGNVACKAQINAISIVRPDNEPIVVTIMVYNTVKVARGGKHTDVTISSEDVSRAIDDMTKMYSLCDTTCKLSELPVMLAKLTPQEKAVIATKLFCDPPITAPPAYVDPFKPNDNALRSVV
jgi:hypothetical protein